MISRPKRVGKTKTFGISVDAETETFLRQEADARFEGNVSRLVTALAREERSRQAAAWLLQHSKGYKPMTDEELATFVTQVAPPQKRRKKRAA